MDGVTILNTIEDAQYSFGWWKMSTIFAGCAAAALICVIVLIYYHKYMSDRGVALKMKAYKIALRSCLAALIILIGCTVGSCFFAHKMVCYDYQVLVGDEVNFNDFMERYEIIDKQGITYIVRNDAETYWKR